MPYIATVELLLDVVDESQAADAVGEILRGTTRKFAGPTSCVLDWRHAAEIVETKPIPVDFEEDGAWPARY